MSIAFEEKAAEKIGRVASAKGGGLFNVMLRLPV
jgi:hypothetical protein